MHSFGVDLYKFANAKPPSTACPAHFAQFDHFQRSMISSLMQLFGMGNGRGPWPC
jgi:hypothetical protein